MRIIGPPSADYSTVRANCLKIVQPRFMTHMFDPLWYESVRLGLDPLGPIAQSIGETKGGEFTGKVKWEANNTCGLKIKYTGIYGPPTDGDEPAAHAQFPSWKVGARAHVQHVIAYAGKLFMPKDELIVDPRYDWVDDTLENWKEMNNKWAKPGNDYGTNIEIRMNRLKGIV